MDVDCDPKRVSAWAKISRGACACVLSEGNLCMCVRVCVGGGCAIKQPSPFVCVKCVSKTERQRRERELGSKGISIGCKRGKGSCFQPDLAQREGVSLCCLVLSCGSLQLVFHSTHCQIPVKIATNS